MSLIWMDGFSGYTMSEIPNYWLPINVSPPLFGGMNTFFGLPARTGTQSIVPTIFGIARSLGIPPNGPFDYASGSQSNVIIGAAYFFPQSGALAPGHIFRFYNNGPLGTLMLSLSWQADGLLHITKTNASTFLAETDPKFPISGGMYNYIEWQTGFGSSATNVVKINGQQVYSGTLNGSVSSLTTADVYAIFGPGMYDDLYVLANDGNGLTSILGDSSVNIFIPSSDGSLQEWTMVPPAAGHFVNVKEIPLDFNGSYNASAGAGTRDTYNVTPTEPSTDTISAVQLSQATISDGPQARPFITINGTNFTTSGDNYTPPSTYVPVQCREYTNQPLTSSPWTPADFNLTSWGIEEV